jgi:hypothetical protein
MDAAKFEEQPHEPRTGEQPPREPESEIESLLRAATLDLGNFVRQSPVLALAGAFAVGYLVAKIVRAVK